MPEITDNTDKSRFEALVDGTLAGFAEYSLANGIIAFTHTEIFPQFEGQGIGSKLARGALDQVKEDGTLKVLAVCPFIKGWIQRNTDYMPLLYDAA
ncbi:MAG: N-acetyltransferase [Propionibacteriaceae bacterium]|jgi:predicted GNAT family acetyltransferase|nr:N-acetyltransferase [Propionibacteriaceae bacterium]